MPSFTQSLEKTLHGALQNATDRSHEYATLEHLLLALLELEAGADAGVLGPLGVDKATAERKVVATLTALVADRVTP
mgnify:CR=1 FL=1